MQHFQSRGSFQFSGHLLTGRKFFAPQQLQGLKSSAETLCLNFGQVLHPWVSYQQNPNFYDSWATKTKETKLNQNRGKILLRRFYLRILWILWKRGGGFGVRDMAPPKEKQSFLKRHFKTYFTQIVIVIFRQHFETFDPNNFTLSLMFSY